MIVILFNSRIFIITRLFLSSFLLIVRYITKTNHSKRVSYVINCMRSWLCNLLNFWSTNSRFADSKEYILTASILTSSLRVIDIQSFSKMSIVLSIFCYSREYAFAIAMSWSLISIVLYTVISIDVIRSIAISSAMIELDKDDVSQTTSANISRRKVFLIHLKSTTRRSWSIDAS